MKTLLIALALLSAPGPDTDQIDSTIISASRAGISTPVVYTNISGEQLKTASPGYSLPMTLALQPSVVATSEGGTGLGYSYMSIRGVGAYQTNVTLNGITLNDAESQEVFWANLPSLSSVLGSVQLQRGLGTSSNGPGAFGASINMVTSNPGPDPSARADISFGSYNTLTYNVKASTGIMGKGFFADAAYSGGITDGYMDNAFANVKMLFADAGWRGSSDALKFTFLKGIQRSGITWNGVPLDIYPENRTYNANMGDTDNYWQSHLQMNYMHQFSSNVAWNTTLNYTHGNGFYDISGIKDEMANDLYVLRTELVYSSSDLSVTGGAYLSQYKGDYSGDAGYSNNSDKSEVDAWVRAELTRGHFAYYADAQFRFVNYDMTGPDEYGQTLDYHQKWPFFNPRAGVSYLIDKHNRAYLSVAYGHREPARADIQAESSVKPEKMVDIELGHAFTGEKYTHSWNAYAMEYRDILLETGRINDGGYAVKDNVPKARRMGVEYNYDWRVFDWLEAFGSVTRSLNKIVGAGDILRSPGKVRSTSVTFRPISDLAFTWTTRFVGSQYWDNTSCKERMIPEYRVTDINVVFNTMIRRGCKFTVGAYVNNLFNKNYYSYAWVYRIPVGNGSLFYQKEGLFPQALRNFSIKLSLEF